MTYEKKTIIQSNPYKRPINQEKSVKNVYWGEVISIRDNIEGGRIQVRIPDLDNKTPNENLPYAYPLLPKYFHIFPQPGEVVRILIEDVQYPQRSRFWIGSVISQLQKIEFDTVYTALATTNLGTTAPEQALETIPSAKGVFPKQNDVALIGKNNTDLILRVGDAEMRAGKHVLDDVLELNQDNPASVRLVFEQNTGNTDTTSSVITMADKIALISHDGIPKFKATEVDQQERERIFNQAHPLGRGDLIVEAFELLRRAIIEHIHPYSKMPTDISGIINDLERIDFTQILQNNILIN